MSRSRGGCGAVIAVLALSLSAGAPRTLAAEAAAPDRALSFPQALAELTAYNPTLAAARDEERQRHAERSAAWGLFLPRVDLQGRWTQIDDEIVLDLDPIRSVMLTLHPGVPAAMVPHFLETVEERDFRRAELTATWPVFTGGRIVAANRAAGARVDEAVARRHASEGDLTAELVRRYYGLRLAARVHLVRQQVLQDLDEHERQAARMRQEGLIARAEELHAAVARAEAERALAAAEADVAIARTALADLLGGGPVQPTSPLFVPAPVESLEVFAAAAREHSPLLGQVAAQRRQARQGLRAEQGQWLPEVYLFGQRELVPEDLTILDPKWAVGVGARLALFDGFARENRVRAARAQEQRVAHLEQSARDGVNTLVEKRWQELRKAREQSVSLYTARELAEEYLRVRRRAFQEGLATSLEVVDAELALARVRVEQLAAAQAGDVALAELLSACGQSDRFESYRSRAGEEVEP